MSLTKSLTWLTLILILKALVIVAIILYAGIGLGPDEAQYWTWSRKLDWGYYSKPPAIAWAIWLGTEVFGQTELGVRSHAIVVGTLLAYAVFILSYCSTRNARQGFYAALFFALSPLGFFSSFLAITDGGLALFWTLACAVVAQALYQKQPPNFGLLGLVIMTGALFKWPIYAFWLIFLALCGIYPEWRQPRKILLAMALSLLGLLPSLVWNFQHEWVTFRHVWSTLYVPAQSQPKTAGNFWDFLGAQAILVSPIFFVLLGISYFFLCKQFKKIPAAIAFLGGYTGIILGAFLFTALFKKMQGNWADFIYPSAFVFLTWVWMDYRPRMRILWGGLALSLALTFLGFGITFYQTTALPKIPYGISPFKHNVGWENLHSLLEQQGYDPKKDFLFGDKYQMASLLSFYGPEQKRAYFLNLHHIRKNQFSFWPSMADEQRGRDGFFVVAENQPHFERKQDEMIAFYLKTLSLYFEKVEYLGAYPLFKNHGEWAKGALIFKGRQYNGRLPEDPELY